MKHFWLREADGLFFLVANEKINGCTRGPLLGGISVTFCKADDVDETLETLETLLRLWGGVESLVSGVYVDS